MISIAILSLLLSSIYIFSQNITLIFFINISVLFLLSIFDERKFIITYIGYLFTYKFLIPYNSIDAILELLPIFLNFLLIIPMLIKYSQVKIYRYGFIIKLFFPLLAIVCSMLLSFFVNQSNVFELVRWNIWILNIVPLLFYVYYSRINHIILMNDIKNLLIILFLIQVPIVSMQFGDTFLNYSSNPDTFSGTLGPGGTSFLSFFCSMLFYFMAYDSLVKKNFLKILLLIPIILLLTFISDIVFTIVVCILFPVIILLFRKFFNINFSKRFIRNSLLISVVVLVLFSGKRIKSIYDLVDSQESVFNSNRLNVQELVYYSSMITTNEDGLKFGRSLGLLYSFNSIVESNFTNQIFGYGPGSTRSEKSVVQNTGPPKIRPVPHTNFFGIDRIILEFGFLGLFLFIYLFFVIGKFTLGFNSDKNLEKTYFLILFVYFIYGAVYDGGWFFNPLKNGIFWIITGLVFSYLDQKHYEKNYLYSSKRN